MKKMRRHCLALAAGLTLALSLSACGGGDQDAPESGSPDKPEPTSAPVAVQPSVGDRDFWNGDWYGVWVVTNGEGACEPLAGMQNGCCAAIYIEDSGDGMLLAWDYTGSRDDYDSQLCNTLLTLEESGTGADYLQATEGRFWDEDLPEDWLVLRASSLEGWESYEDALVVTSEYHVDDGENVGEMQYIIFLRPWGTEWSDMESEAPGMLPPDYYDWYLPQLEAGSPMPDSYE